MKDILEAIRDLIESQELTPQPPASSLAIATYEKSIQEFNQTLPPELKELFADQNGIFTDDFCIFYVYDPSSKSDLSSRAGGENDISEANHYWRAREHFPKHFLLIGAGDFGLMVHNQMADEFSLIDEDSFDVLDSYPTLEELLDEILLTIEENGSEEEGEE